MMRRQASRMRSAAFLALAIIGVTGAGPGGIGGLGARRVDPAEVLPIHLVNPDARDEVAEVISEHSFHHKGQPETFPCDPQLYLSLLNEPGLTLALWQRSEFQPRSALVARTWGLPGDRRQRDDRYLELRASISPEARFTVQHGVSQPERDGPSRRPNRAHRQHELLQGDDGHSLDPARCRGLRQNRLPRLASGGQDVPPPDRATTRGPDSGSGMVRLLDGSTGRDLSRLGGRGDLRSAADSGRNSGEVSLFGDPSSTRRLLDRATGAD